MLEVNILNASTIPRTYYVNLGFYAQCTAVILILKKHDFVEFLNLGFMVMLISKGRDILDLVQVK